MAVIDSGNLVLDKQEVDIHEIIKKVKSSLNLMVEKNGGKISLQLSAFQPMIFADALHLFNMIYNLVDNAIKYNQNQPLISINSSGNEQEFQINISDNGIGMTSEVQKHIFDRFFRQPTGDVHNVKGFGLGLAYVKRMMDAHNGHIKLDSQPGKGTTFSLVFPRK
jgi:two-component system phosphate regulon sensor histidine kinase PhoR